MVQVLALITSILLLSATAPDGAAQMVSYAAAGTTNDAEADKLERRAQELFDEPPRYAEAGRMYERAAGLRRRGDSRMVDALFSASRLYYHARMHGESIEVLKRAAEEALASGDVYRAAESLIDAAWVLAAIDRREEAIPIKARAELLTTSPLFRDHERLHLRTRLGLEKR
jgi:hypothetical protein